MIDDENYSHELEGVGVDDRRFPLRVLKNSGYPTDKIAIDLYSDFQFLHDFISTTSAAKYWFDMTPDEQLLRLKKIADKFELTCFDEVPEPLTDLPACVDYSRQGEREQ